jgi:hypothetical protein
MPKNSKKFRMYLEYGHFFQKTSTNQRKCRKFPALCQNYRFACYAGIIAGIFRLGPMSRMGLCHLALSEFTEADEAFAVGLCTLNLLTHSSKPAGYKPSP